MNQLIMEATVLLRESILRYLLLVSILLTATASPMVAQPQDELGPFAGIAPEGSDIISAGTGLFLGQGVPGEGSFTLVLPSETIAVNAAYFYYAGRYESLKDPAECPSSAEITVNGQAVTGSLVGESPAGVLDLAYCTFRADASSFFSSFSPANMSFDFDIKGFTALRPYGLSVLVAYDDGTSNNLIDVREGHDFAWWLAGDIGLPASTTRTERQTYEFPAAPVGREATLRLMVGDTQADRQDHIIVWVNGTEVLNEFNFFVAGSGPEWSDRAIPITIPAQSSGTSVVEVELFSEGDADGDGNPDEPSPTNGLDPESISWIVSTLSVEPPPTGPNCTFTWGFWKNHFEDWPSTVSPQDIFFLSNMTWAEVLGTPVRGNQYYNLAHQYIAAKLNSLNGADVNDLNGALTTAEGLFNTYTPADIAGLRGNNPTRKNFVNTAATLDAFNNGEIGPGHCNDQEEEFADDTSVSRESPGKGNKGKGKGNGKGRGKSKSAALGQEVHEIGQAVPTAFDVIAYPNPVATGQATIEFSLPQSATVRVQVYNLLGQRVKSFGDNYGAGTYPLQFSTDDLAPGPYFYRVSTPMGEKTGQIRVVR